METLKRLAVKHPYYCSDSNWYSNDANEKYSNMTEFLNAWEDADVDMNLCFRWDITADDEESEKAGRYKAEVFIMIQRKGIFKPMYIESVNEIEAIRFEAYAKKHWETVVKLWNPLSNVPSK